MTPDRFHTRDTDGRTHPPNDPTDDYTPDVTTNPTPDPYTDPYATDTTTPDDPRFILTPTDITTDTLLSRHIGPALDGVLQDILTHPMWWCDECDAKHREWVVLACRARIRDDDPDDPDPMWALDYSDDIATDALKWIYTTLDHLTDTHCADGWYVGHHPDDPASVGVYPIDDDPHYYYTDDDDRGDDGDDPTTNPTDGLAIHNPITCRWCVRGSVVGVGGDV